MWYVRFGGDEFGPFEHSELTHFLGQLGTTSAVEVRQGEAAEWSSIDEVPSFAGLRDSLTSSHGAAPLTEDDRTLMSSDVSPALLEEFRALLDADEDVPNEIGNPPPSTETFSRKTEPKLLPENIQADPIANPVHDTESTSANDSQSLADLMSGIRSQRTEDDSSLGDKLGTFGAPPTAAMMVASPLKKSQPIETPMSPSRPRANALGLIPPKNQNEMGRSMVSEETKPISVPTLLDNIPKPTEPEQKARTAPVSKPVFSSPPRSNHLRITIIAMLVTVVVGGLGAFGLWRLTSSRDAARGDLLHKRTSAEDEKRKKAEQNEATEPSHSFSYSETEVAPVEKSVGAGQSLTSDRGEQSTGQNNLQRANRKLVSKSAARRRSKSVGTNKSSRVLSQSRDRRTRNQTKNSKAVVLDRAKINRVMSSRLTALRRCGAAAGIKLTASLEVAGGGQVRRAQLAGAGKLRGNQKSCLIKVLKKTRFPQTGGPPQRFRVPIRL